jgi:hypothetical protein
MDMTTIISLAEAGKAKIKNDGDRRRIDRAVELIQSGHVHRFDDTHYLVKSQRSEDWYTVNGTCNCKDATTVSGTMALNGQCKHMLAVRLLKRARELAQPERTNVDILRDQLDLREAEWIAATHALEAVQAKDRALDTERTVVAEIKTAITADAASAFTNDKARKAAADTKIAAHPTVIALQEQEHALAMELAAAEVAYKIAMQRMLNARAKCEAR